MVTVSVVQMDVVRSDVRANLEKGVHFVKEAKKKGSNLVCFPEMWTTGFQLEANKTLCKKQDQTLQEIQKICKEHKIWLSGSILQQNSQGMPTNSHVLIDDQGNLAAKYNKIHLFSFMNEDKYVSPGDHLEIVDTPFSKVGLTVCYDIRFCELFRSLALKGAELILSPMAFPHPRLEHYRVLIRARAIENQLFMISANQVGKEDFSDLGFEEISYLGHSCIIDPFGKTLVEAEEDIETVLTAEINPEESANIRKKMHVLDDRRPDLYELD